MLIVNPDEIKEIFIKVKALGFVKSNRRGNTGIGKTFEDFCGIAENNIDAPDLCGYEIKSKRELAKNRVTLFTKAPTWPKGANAYLKDNFGTPDRQFPDVKVLHTSVFHRRYNTHKSGHAFKLECDEVNQCMYLVIKNLSTDVIISKEVYWSYPVLRNIIESKLQNLAFVTAKHRVVDGSEEFHFTDMTLYSDITFERLLDYIKAEDGLMFDVRIGAYKSGRMYGRPHDHGSGFRIKPEQLHGLYKTKIEV